jgi:hypothetical protein
MLARNRKRGGSPPYHPAYLANGVIYAGQPFAPRQYQEASEQEPSPPPSPSPDLSASGITAQQDSELETLNPNIGSISADGSQKNASVALSCTRDGAAHSSANKIQPVPRVSRQPKSTSLRPGSIDSRILFEIPSVSSLVIKRATLQHRLRAESLRSKQGDGVHIEAVAGMMGI